MAIAESGADDAASTATVEDDHGYDLLLSFLNPSKRPPEPMTSNLQDQAVARGRLVELHDDKIVIGVPGTEYQVQLVSTAPSGAITTEVGKRIKGTIHARALRMHASSAGGRFIEPVWGPPRIMSGTVLAVDADHNRLLVDVSLPMWVAMQDGQQADSFAPGQMVNFYVESGTTFTPLEAS